jgi:hypothetical protein
MNTTTTVSVKTAIARANRRVSWWKNGRSVVRSRSHGERQLGDFLFVQNNYIVDGFNIDRFERFLLEKDVLAPWEKLER